MRHNPWVEGMSVGVEILDVQHRQMASGLKAIADDLAAHAFDAARRDLDALSLLVANHAELEVTLLRRLGFPGIDNIISAQARLRDRLAGLSDMIESLSPGAEDCAYGAIDAFVAYILRGDISFKSYVLEMRDTGRMVNCGSDAQRKVSA